MDKEKVLKMKPSAYRSMLMGKLGLTKSNPEKKKDLIRWGNANKGEKWINLTALITDKKKQPCGMKGKNQIKLNLPSVCRPSVRVNKKTPKPLASELSVQKIKKAIQIKKKGKRINWNEL
jgi:hypothetical protein